MISTWLRHYTDPTGQSLFSAIFTGTIVEALFTATCGALVIGLTGGAGAPLADVGCFYAGSALAGWAGYEQDKQS
jgi:hypothetical protein